MTDRLHAGVFDREESLLAALRDCRDLPLDVVDVLSPYPVHGVDELAGIKRSRLPAVCLAGGLTGLGLALWFQYWTSAVDWPLDVGGKPFDSLPAFIPVAFEMTILLAGVATVVFLLARSKLWPGRSPSYDGLGATDDRFVLVISKRGASLSDAELAALWRDNGAERTVELEGAPS